MGTGRGITRSNKNWVIERYIELHTQYPHLSKKAIAERVGMNYSTFCAILREDGRCVKRRKAVEL